VTTLETRFRKCWQRYTEMADEKRTKFLAKHLNESLLPGMDNVLLKWPELWGEVEYWFGEIDKFVKVMEAINGR